MNGRIGRWKARRILSGCGALLLFSWTVSAKTYHVAQENQNADDNAAGELTSPWKTMSKAARVVQPGDTVLIHGGVYRETVILKTSGTADAPIRFEAAPGEHVVLTGADRLTAWKKTAGARPIYEADWPHKFIGWNPSMTHPGDEYHRVIGRCEQVIVNGYLFRQVLQLDQLAPGAFFADVTNRALIAWDTAGRDLTKCLAEASVRQEVLRVEGDHVRIRGLHFRYAANMAQHGAVVLAGRFDVMEDCVVELMNSSGATIQGEDATIRRCVFRDNGQLGFGASKAHRLLFTENSVENNNTKNFDRGWEAGGDKLVLCRDAVLEGSRFVRNHGNGIWFDIGNTNCTVRQCLIAENDDAGIFYEISFALHAHDNVILENGFAPTAGAWGAQAGISLSSSPGCLIERNLIAGNREGFNFREQSRTTPTIDDSREVAIWNHDEVIRNNLFVYNRDAQVWGWFDTRDDRHWPAEGKRENSERLGASDGNLAAPYLAKSPSGQPGGLSLEKLNLRFEENIYFAAPGQKWFAWGPGWMRHKIYSGVGEFASALRIDWRGRAFEPPFADCTRRDFRVSVEAMHALGESYPKGQVPNVVLGTLPVAH